MKPSMSGGGTGIEQSPGEYNVRVRVREPFNLYLGCFSWLS